MKFSERVYRLTKKVSKGRVTTYRIIAQKLKCRAYRAVGNALNKNLNKNIPCHRVVNSDGRAGGFARGSRNKIELLKKEGIKIKKTKIKNFEKVLFRF